MARTFTPKVNKHVTYYDSTTRPRPAIITAVTSATVVDLRVGHGETHAAVNKKTAKPFTSGWHV